MRQILSFIALFFIVFSLSAQQVNDFSRVDLSSYAKGIYVVQRQNRKGYIFSTCGIGIENRLNFAKRMLSFCKEA